MIHLDTNFLIRGLVRGSEQDAQLRLWLRTGEPLSISAVAWAEFLCGPVAPRVLELAARIVPERISFTADDAAVAAQLFNDSGRRRGTLVDCMIAATAIRVRAALATSNPRDFRPFAGAGLTLLK